MKLFGGRLELESEGRTDHVFYEEPAEEPEE